MASSDATPMRSRSSRPFERPAFPTLGSPPCRPRAPFHLRPTGSLNAIPTTDAEQPGIGGTIGRVVGGAAGTAGGLAVASLALPGVGPVIAAGAIALGLIGAAAGGAVGSHLDDTLSKGLPTDELYVYRHALQMGRSIVVAMVEDDAQAVKVRELIAGLGAESVDAAREEWWVGLRDAEEAEYTRQGGDFRKDEALYRPGIRRGVPPAPRGPALRRCALDPAGPPRAGGRGASLPGGLRAWPRSAGVRRVGHAGCGPRSGNRRSDADHPVPGLSGRRMCVAIAARAPARRALMRVEVRGGWSRRR